MKHINISLAPPTPGNTKSADTPKRPADPRWHALDLLRLSKTHFNLKDRDIAVLRGLLSLMPVAQWGSQMVVFASNRVLSERCDGIEERTLRRRLNKLAEVGIVLRKLSPSGKRYQIKDQNNATVIAYGIDLSPLCQLVPELETIAENCRHQDIQAKSIKALIRDRLYNNEGLAASTLGDYARRSLRRKLSVKELQTLIQNIDKNLPPETSPRAATDLTRAHEMSDSDSQIVRHIQNSNKEDLDSEGETTTIPETAKLKNTDNAKNKEGVRSDISVFECMEAATTARSMCSSPPRTWADVTQLAKSLGPAIGLHPKAIAAADERLGEYGCALAILGLVEAYGRIKNPQAYLNALTKKARDRGLDCVKMFWSLTTPKHKQEQFV